MPVAKMLAQVLAAVLAAVVPLLAVGPLGPVEWVNVAIVALGALAVFAGPNVPYAARTKAILSALTAAAVVLHELIIAAGGVFVIDTSGWLQIVLAVLGALGVYAVPNTGARTHRGPVVAP